MRLCLATIWHPETLCLGCDDTARNATAWPVNVLAVRDMLPAAAQKRTLRETIVDTMQLRFYFLY